MLDELLTFVRDHNLGRVFNYKSPMGNEPLEVGLGRLQDGLYFVLVNGPDGDSRMVARYGLSEQDACELCRKYLSMHL